MSERRSVSPARLTRRALIEGSAAGAALALLPGCETPAEHIVPYVARPPEATPGVSRYYATAALRSGVAIGVLGESRDGRPIKIEGNPDHPFSLGAAGPTEQALPYTLYDSDRLRAVSHRGAPSAFDAFVRAIASEGRRFVRGSGDGLHLWLEPTTSPLIEALLARVLERYPRARVWFDPSRAPTCEWEGARRVFGRPLAAQYAFDRADRVLALDADFLTCGPGALRWSHDWALRRRPEGSMSRCYAVDATPTGTSASCDHRAIARSSEIGAIAGGLLAALGRAERSWLERAPHARWIEIVARDLAEHRGRSLVVCGDRQPPHVHALVWLINAALGSVGEAITVTRSPWLDAGGAPYSPASLMDALDRDEVDALIVLGGNPAYTASGTMSWATHARRADDLVVLAPYSHETARLASWVLPELHLLERWGDARAYDGTWTPIQPLIRPLFGGHSMEQVLLALAGEPHGVVRDVLIEQLGAAGHDAAGVLARGFVDGSASSIERVDASSSALAPALDELAPSTGGYELDLRPDSRIEDGTHAENAWLQELPEAMTKLVWDNAAILSERDARALGVATGDVVEITAGQRSIRIPVLPMRGQAAGAIVVWLGFGRTAGGAAARSVGVDACAMRGDPDAWWIGGVRVRATGERCELATTQKHFDLPPEEVPIVLRRGLRFYRQHPDFAQRHDERQPSLHADRLEGAPQWGMAIDLGLCTGCQACVVACQAENNVPVVGKTQVLLGREMHWLRIDRYVDASRGQERSSLQPMLCQHCEKAPCEYVCPVNATTHSPDGLNEMTYNRCVGTRFCSNNCPYKVRRFNYFDWHADAGEPEIMAFNPDVTVRSRGVMEKCTYCVQRIRREQIRARVEERELADGDVVTACQQACPSGTIVFGDVANPRSRVSRWHASPRTYAVLHELGTRPRTRYLARIDNSNEELEGG